MKPLNRFPVWGLEESTQTGRPQKTSALAVEIGPLALKNPLMTASGTFGYGDEMQSFLDPGVYGAIVGKSISLAPRQGNPLPRVAETASGMLNSIGLQNPGFEAFLRDYLPRMRRYETAIVVNLVGDTVEEYVTMAAGLEKASGVSAIELNISCPNCPVGGMEFGIEAGATERLVRAVRQTYSGPLIAKLTPNVTDVVPIAKAAEAGGADALSLVNTFVGMGIDWRTRRPLLGGVTGGLSGPAIKPLALRLVWRVAEACRVPIIGIGGIMTADDVLEFLVAGATAVQLGTVQFIEPRAAVTILGELEKAVQAEGLNNIAELVGTIEIKRQAITVRAEG